MDAQYINWISTAGPRCLVHLYIVSRYMKMDDPALEQTESSWAHQYCISRRLVHIAIVSRYVKLDTTSGTHSLLTNKLTIQVKNLNEPSS